MSEALSINLAKSQRTAFMVAVGGAVLLGLGYLQDSEQFYRSYLIAFLYWLAPSLGALAVVMIHNLSGGAWGFAIRRLLEAAIRNVPLMAVLFVPIVIGGIGHLYEWSHADAVAADPILQHKAAYLNRSFFTVRGVLYFAVWIFLALATVRLSARYDRTLSEATLLKLRAVSGLGLVAYVMTMSFAAFDWGMSLEPHWFSTIYGVLFCIGQVLAALCFAVIVASRIARHEPFTRWFAKSHFHDLGNLMMAFVMLWAYVSFSQFLIIWSGNLPEETPWYLNRTAHGWQLIAFLLVAFHFVAPFLLLLNRRAKRNVRPLVAIAAALLVMRFLDIFWLIAPAFPGTNGSGHGSSFHVEWMDVAAPVAVGALWLGMFIKNLRGRPLVSLQDGALLESLEEGTAPEPS